jgi:hypothetical protein
MRHDIRHHLRLVAAAAVVCAGGAVFAPPAAAVSAAGRTTAVSSGDFPHPLKTTARYFPLTPGQRYTYDGTLREQGGPPIKHRVVFTVTDLVKTIDGIPARVILDQDYNDGALVEAELTFFAQDKDANVWTLGEYPEEYEDGKFAGAPNVWISGIHGAVGGVLVPGRPRTGTPRFVQGKAPAIDFFDVGRVVATGLRACVPSGCYDKVVKVSETAPLAPEDGNQLKFYAPQVGLIQVKAQGGGAQETLTLTSVTSLGLRAMNVARKDALRLDVRGHITSKDYRKTGSVHL